MKLFHSSRSKNSTSRNRLKHKMQVFIPSTSTLDLVSRLELRLTQCDLVNRLRLWAVAVLGGHPTAGHCYFPIGVTSHRANEQCTHEGTDGKLGSCHVQMEIKSTSPADRTKIQYGSFDNTGQESYRITCFQCLVLQILKLRNKKSVVCDLKLSFIKTPTVELHQDSISLPEKISSFILTR